MKSNFFVFFPQPRADVAGVLSSVSLPQNTNLMAQERFGATPQPTTIFDEDDFSRPGVAASSDLAGDLPPSLPMTTTAPAYFTNNNIAPLPHSMTGSLSPWRLGRTKASTTTAITVMPAMTASTTAAASVADSDAFHMPWLSNVVEDGEEDVLRPLPATNHMQSAAPVRAAAGLERFHQHIDDLELSASVHGGDGSGS